MNSNMTEQEIKIRAICAILTGRTSNPDYADIAISTIVSEAIHASDLLITELWKEEQSSPQIPSHRWPPFPTLHTRRALSTSGKPSISFENVQLGNQSGYITVKEGPDTTNDGDYWSSWKAVWTPTHCSKKNASENRCMSDIFRTFAKSSLKVLLVKIWGK